MEVPAGKYLMLMQRNVSCINKIVMNDSGIRQVIVLHICRPRRANTGYMICQRQLRYLRKFSERFDQVVRIISLEINVEDVLSFKSKVILHAVFILLITNRD